MKAHSARLSAKALLLSCFLLLGVNAEASDLVWQYTTTNVGPTVTIERAFYVVADNFFYRVSNSVGSSNTVQVLIPVSEVDKLKDSICRAAKAMGGTATTFAGRIRKEVPCL
jgi:hypothetical protein